MKKNIYILILSLFSIKCEVINKVDNKKTITKENGCIYDSCYPENNYFCPKVWAAFPDSIRNHPQFSLDFEEKGYVDEIELLRLKRSYSHLRVPNSGFVYLTGVSILFTDTSDYLIQTDGDFVKREKVIAFFSYLSQHKLINKAEILLKTFYDIHYYHKCQAKAKMMDSVCNVLRLTPSSAERFKQKEVELWIYDKSFYRNNHIDSRESNPSSDYVVAVLWYDNPQKYEVISYEIGVDILYWGNTLSGQLSDICACKELSNHAAF